MTRVWIVEGDDPEGERFHAPQVEGECRERCDERGRCGHMPFSEGQEARRHVTDAAD